MVLYSGQYCIQIGNLYVLSNFIITNSDLERPCFAWHPYGKSGLFKTELVIKQCSELQAGEDRFLNSFFVSGNGVRCVCGDEVSRPTPLLVWDHKIVRQWSKSCYKISN